MIVMNAGIVEQIGRPRRLRRPRERVRGGFIGSPAMNFLPGKRAGDDIDVGGGGLIPCRLR